MDCSFLSALGGYPFFMKSVGNSGISAGACFESVAYCINELLIADFCWMV